MSNTLLTINMITKEAVRLWKNTNNFMKRVDTQYDDSFAVSGAKIGTNLRIRLPNDFTVRTGAATSVQNVTENNTSLALATQKGVDLAFTSVDMTMSVDDFSKRYLAPAVNNLAGAVAVDIMSGSEGGVSNYVDAESGGAIIQPTVSTILQANAILDLFSAPSAERLIVTDPVSDARIVGALAGYFNPATAISEQYRSGAMRNALGFDWLRDQTVIKHTTGSFSAGTVNGASQTGTTLTVNAITGTLNVGDIITLAGVHSVNRINKQSNGTLAQFVVTAAAANGATSLSIYPAIIAGNVQYATVDVSPANSAAISLAHPASSVFRKNIAFVPEAVTMATADLVKPNNVEVGREVLDNVSMRMVKQYAIGTDQEISRLDVLYGYLWVRPEWAVIVADAL